jgi:competence protein ComEA
MPQGSKNFLAGFMTSLLATGLLILFLSEPRGHPVQLKPVPSPLPLKVHVAGAVLHPGVYELPPQSLVQQAIDAAGGPLESAILDVVNLAAQLENGQQIYIPLKDETQSNPILLPSATVNRQKQININTATAPELETLPGIGPSLAQKIVSYRETHGPFLKPDDLLNVAGIGPAKLEQISALITVR